MAPKKKKVPHNGFYFFMLHYKREQESRGIRPGNMSEISEAAGPLWTALSPAEKAVFENLARQEKIKDRNNLENKFTTTGISYAQLEREEREKREKDQRMKHEIESTVRNLDVPAGIVRHPFYFIHVNYYCRMECGTYIPCEIAVARFTLRKGIDDTYHTIITQEEIPLGYTFEAKKTSEDSHQIPLPPVCFGESDYFKLFQNLKSFVVEGGNATGIIPPLYTLPMHMDPVKSVLSTLQESSTDDCTDFFRVYPLPHLFFELRNACARYADTAGFPVMSLAERELDKDVFNFNPGLSCDFHEHKDSVQYCSLSIVKRWGYLIADHSCRDVDIQLVPGNHVPLCSDTARHIDMHRRRLRENSGVGDAPSERLSSSVSMGAIPKSSRTKPGPVSVIDYSKRPAERSSSTNIPSISSPGSTSPWEVKTESSPTKPLRQPRTAPRAMVGVLSNPSFTEDDFPPIGEQGGIYGRFPVVVAGRGRGAVRVGINSGTGTGAAAGPSVGGGRGRGLNSSFKNMSLQ